MFTIIFYKITEDIYRPFIMNITQIRTSQATTFVHTSTHTQISSKLHIITMTHTNNTLKRQNNNKCSSIIDINYG